MRRLIRALLVPAAGFLWGACTSGGNGAGDAGPAWTPCTIPVADACDGGFAGAGVQCIPSLVDACGSGAPIAGVTTCGDFVELTYGRGADTASYEVYGATSKQLVAIIEFNAITEGWVCNAGPPGFVLPTCSRTTTPLACLDAGDAADANAE